MHENLKRETLVAQICAMAGPVYVMLVGLPGSGKSTLAKALAQLGFRLLSMDDMVAKRPLLAVFWSTLETLFQSKYRKALKEQVNIVDDNLNVNPDTRLDLLKQAREAGYGTVLIVFVDTPLEVCLARNAIRADPAAEWDLERVWQDLHGKGLPTAREAELLTISPNPEETEYRATRQPYAPPATPPSRRWRWLMWLKEQLSRFSR